ncbi:hypothetical protein I3843_05G177300 [Carya illinoinensis]|uniref:Uncharacterized protein n=1 Tax=Carya illinoinensis TaxID=32201 RepID=A0A8T1QM70_CARIL|nr:uncharacterized protein LOC122311120 [Carya illinoinensis]KAG2708487.1 hypothetical protein I3760_05G195800 [Carya illinoinensis]KAG6655194.1 hypothetical protein CIPAW_05G198700 [Carya illinoinensis]KAG6714228.1 hypothetical protein I3842_05G193500 [Carya illinoinensis]KAG7980329.1 hypothetical protein I3843_05G177300 [Carya illinoinensis]
MALKIKTLILLLLILLIPLSGLVEGFKDRMNPNHHLLYKDGNRMMKYYYSRKLQELDSLLDYDDAGPNPKHDPNPRKNRGGGSRNP